MIAASLLIGLQTQAYLFAEHAIIHIRMKSKNRVTQQIAFNVFRLSLYGFITATALFVVFSQPDSIKQAFIDTGAYERFVPQSIAAAAKANQTSGSAPIQDSEIQKIIASSFPSVQLRAETEKVIDSGYAWLRGQVASPYFVIDFSSNIDQMAAGLSAYAMQRLGSLPVCLVNPQVVDPFTATCQPKSFNYEAEQQALAESIRENNGIMTNTKLTVHDLPKAADGTTFIQQYSYAPRLFQIMQLAPYVLFVTMVASAVAVVAVDRKKYDAVYRVGKSTIGATIFLILSPLFYFYVLPLIFPDLSIESSSGGGGAVLADVANKVAIEFSNQLIVVGLVVLAVATMTIVIAQVTRPKSKYVRVNKKAGLVTSESPRTRQGRMRLIESTVPIQSSEGERSLPKYQKTSRYRKIADKEYR